MFGLLAALGTAIGVLVAVVGLPYGRADYSAFAELYHGNVNTAGTVHMAVDCNTSTAATDDNCTIFLPAASTQVDVTASNSTSICFQSSNGSWNSPIAPLPERRRLKISRGSTSSRRASASPLSDG